MASRKAPLGSGPSGRGGRGAGALSPGQATAVLRCWELTAGSAGGTVIPGQCDMEGDTEGTEWRRGDRQGHSEHCGLAVGQRRRIMREKPRDCLQVGSRGEKRWERGSRWCLRG